MAVHRLQGQSSAVTQRSQFTAKSLFHPSPKVTTDQRVRSQIQNVEMKAQRGRVKGRDHAA